MVINTIIQFFALFFKPKHVSLKHNVEPIDNHKDNITDSIGE